MSLRIKNQTELIVVLWWNVIPAVQKKTRADRKAEKAEKLLYIIVYYRKEKVHERSRII